MTWALQIIVNNYLLPHKIQKYNFLCFTCNNERYGHSPIFPSLHLRHNSFSQPSVALPTSQLILQPFFRFSCFSSSSLNSPGEPPCPTPRMRKSRYWGETLQVPHPLLWRDEASLLVQCQTIYFPLALWTLVCAHRVLSAHWPVLLCSEHVNQTSYWRSV